jgi:flagellar basal-body rod modification protein FlgD
MTTAAPTAVAPSASTGATSSAPPSNPGGTLGKEDFLKLMVAQLKSQDPLQPTESSAFIGQLAQFTELEQVTNMAQSTERSTDSQRVAQAVALIGHTVTCVDPASGETHHGTVQSVQITGSGASLTVEGIAGIDPSTITAVS